MSIHIIVHAEEGVQRVCCEEELGMATAVQVAALIHEGTGRNVEVVHQDDRTGKELRCLWLDTIPRREVALGSFF